MTGYIFGALLLFTTLFLGCGHSKDSAHNHDHGSHSEHSGDAQIMLDNGKKWKVDDETKLRIENIRGLLKEFQSQKKTLALSDYNAIGTKVGTEIDGIIKGCSLTGQAHDELHKLLAMFFPELNNLRSNDLDMAKDGLKNIQELIVQFDIFFI